MFADFQTTLLLHHAVCNFNCLNILHSIIIFLTYSDIMNAKKRHDYRSFKKFNMGLSTGKFIKEKYDTEIIPLILDVVMCYYM